MSRINKFHKVKELFFPFLIILYFNLWVWVWVIQGKRIKGTSTTNLKHSTKFQFLFLHYYLKKVQINRTSVRERERERQQRKRNINVDNKRVLKECTPHFLNFFIVFPILVWRCSWKSWRKKRKFMVRKGN